MVLQTICRGGLFLFVSSFYFFSGQSWIQSPTMPVSYLAQATGNLLCVFNHIQNDLNRLQGNNSTNYALEYHDSVKLL